MIRSVEATGKTREAAVRAALLELGITENDNFETEVIAMPKSGFLGLRSTPAKVLVTYDDGRAEPRPAPAPKKDPAPAPAVEKPKKAAPPAPRAEKPAAPAAPQSVKAPAPAPSFDEGTREERTRAFLSGLLERMGVNCDIAISQRENGGLDVKLDGPNMGAVIGRRGETLDAIQHLVNYAVNRGNEKQGHISVDAEDYRSKREESLVRLAEKMAAKAIKYKRSMALEPMNSYERHVIHTALQNYEGVSTKSTGTEPNRRVVVNYERPAGESSRESGRGRNGGGKPRKSAPEAPKAAPEAKSAPAPVREEKAAEPEKLPPDFPEGYVPPAKNKPQSREWC